MATQQNGLTMLGEAIAGGARDYATRKRELEDQERRRAQQLQDVESTRAYERETYNKRRGDQLSDVRTAREYERGNMLLGSQLAAAQALVHEGLLAPADINNQAAVSAAYAEAQRRGLDKIYSELLTTPGPDGKPLLDRSQLGDAAAIEAAKSALGQIKANAARLALDQPGNAAAAVDALAREAAQVRQQLAGVEAKLAETTPTVDQQTVLNRALELAREANGGKPPSQQQIQAMVGQATTEAQNMALQRWYQDKEDAKIQYQILNSRLNSLRQQQSDLTRTFQVAPRASALAEPVAPAAPVARNPVQASPEQRAAALTAAVRAAAGTPQTPAAPPPGQTPTLANPINDPIIEQENQRIAQRNLSAQNKALADPYNEALDQLNAINEQIAGVRAGKRPGLYQGGISEGPYAGDAIQNPLTGAEQAATLSDLLIKQQAVQRNLEARRRAMLGLPAEVTAPVVSTPAGSAPAAYSKPDNWWQGN